MTSQQSYEIEQLAARLGSSDADLLWLARICSASETLNHMGQLARVDAEDVIHTLRTYERVVELATRRAHGGAELIAA